MRCPVPLSSSSEVAAWFARAGVRCLRSRWTFAARHHARRAVRIGEAGDGEEVTCMAAGCLTDALLDGRFRDWVASGEAFLCREP